MPSGDTELRLLWTVLLNGTVFACAFGFVVRIGRKVPRVQQISDALLLTFLVQYTSVGLPGLLRILAPATITLTALLCSGALTSAWIRRDRKPSPTRETSTTLSTKVLFRQSVFVAACIFGISYLGANVFFLRFQPIIATDALAYHFPAALHWLRTGRLSIFPTWFFNPANTYSPLGGSTFITWLMAPEGNDVIARFVQAPAMLLIFFATVQLCRQVTAILDPAQTDNSERTPQPQGSASEIQGATATCLTLPLAGIISVGVIAFRPLLGEASLGKDDLFLTAFLIAGIAGFVPNRLRDRFGPWRIGIALGLCLATKYTSLLALPLFLLLPDAPWRAGWRGRHLLIVLGTVAIIAGPWYLRNLWLTGNPIYPLEVRVGGHTILPGLFQTSRSVDLRSLSMIWKVLAKRYHSVPVPIFCILTLGWLAAIAMARGRLLREPIVRIALLGPPIGLTLFIAFSPYPEVRFVFSSLVLLFVAAAVALSSLPRVPVCVRIGGALIIAIVSMTTGYRLHEVVAACAGISLAFAAGGASLYFAQRRWLHWPPRAWAAAGATTAVVATLTAYVYWNAYVNALLGKSNDTADPNNDSSIWWRSIYAQQADAWNWIRQQTPADATIAYANTSLVYPLSGEERRAIYVPTRRGVRTQRDLPHFPTPVSGEQIIPTVTALLDSDTDAAGWLHQLLASGAGYLVIARDDAGPHPAEIPLAQGDRNHFQLVFEDEHYLIFRIIHLPR